MKDKTGAIVLTLIEKIKRNAHFFGDMTEVDARDSNCAYANITLQNGDITDDYLVIVIKQEKRCSKPY